MKVSEILVENYVDQIHDEIVNLLSVVQARNVNQIKKSQLVIDLRKMGYTIGLDSIDEILDNIDIIASHDKSSITLNGDNHDNDISDISDLRNMVDNFQTQEPEVDPIDAAALRKSKKDMNL